MNYHLTSKLFCVSASLVLVLPLQINSIFVNNKIALQSTVADFQIASNKLTCPPNLTEISDNVGKIKFWAEDKTKAIAIYTQVIESYPSCPYLYFLRGMEYHSLENWQKAIDDYTKAISLKPDYQWAYYRRYFVYKELNNDERASEDLNEAIRLDKLTGNKVIICPPHLSELTGSINEVSSDHEELKRGIEIYTQAIISYPNCEALYFLRGMTYDSLENWQKAIDDYTKAISLKPNYLWAYYRRGLIYFELSSYEKAVDDFSQVIRLDPNDAQFYNDRGFTYGQLGKYENGLDDLNRAISLRDTKAQFYFNRAWLYAQIGKIEESQRDYQKANELSGLSTQETEATPPVTTPPPTPSSEIPLLSSRGINYTKLRDLLAQGQWKKADQETTALLLRVSNREKEDWLRDEDVKNLSCEDLRTMDRLWVAYSQGKFGFSIQREIYQSLGGTSEYNGDVSNKFGERVGWVTEEKDGWGGDWKFNDLTFDLNAKQGHLPAFSGGGLMVPGGHRGVMLEEAQSSFFGVSLVNCNI
jgi:tetratricopeptide (TPR) repeat protein